MLLVSGASGSCSSSSTSLCERPRLFRRRSRDPQCHVAAMHSTTDATSNGNHPPWGTCTECQHILNNFLSMQVSSYSEAKRPDNQGCLSVSLPCRSLGANKTGKLGWLSSLMMCVCK